AWAPIPSPLLTGAVHHHLIRQRTRARVGLITDSGDVRECHHVALLLGYGAAAVSPYLAIASARALARRGELAGISEPQAAANRNRAPAKGWRKTRPRWGGPPAAPPPGPQFSGARGPGGGGAGPCFGGPTPRLGGVGFDVRAAETAHRHRRAFPPHGGGP